MTPKTPLTRADERRLKLVLETGHALEELWTKLPAPSDLTLTRAREHALERLTAAIHALEQADSENLRRLSFHTRNLTLEMTARHLATVLVPFERLLGKALRDDQILIDEGDKTGAAANGLANIAPMRVIADNLRSAFNVGAILRTAECFGVEHVSLSGYTPTPDADKTARTSLGTEKSVSWSSDPNVHDVILQAKKDGYDVVAFETASTAIPLDEFVWPEKVALLLGNERFGLDRDVIEAADHIVKIPMRGTKNSLNVGIACGIALASWRKQVDSGAVATAPNEISYSPIGTFLSHAVHPYEAPRQGAADDSGLESTVRLKDDAQLKLALKDLAGFSHIWLLFDFHHNADWKPLVLPPRGPHEKRGVFATRSPYRPNAIGLSAVELVRIEGRDLIVRATDLLDGTPILDIKPYVPYADSFADARVGWLAEIERYRHQVVFAPPAEEKLKWLEDNGAKNLRGFLQSQLEFDPSDDERKRVSAHPSAPDFRLAYRTWRADFSLQAKQVTVVDISSGYSANDLAAKDDKYGDKDQHRKFLERFSR